MSACGRRPQGGLTLVEILIAIVLMAIVSAATSVFLRPVIDSYFSTQRRAQLTEASDAALRMMARDIRSSVANSIRSASDQCFETVPTAAGGAYRQEPDTVNDNASDCAPGPSCSAALDPSRPTAVFDVLTPLSPLPRPGDWVVVGNQSAQGVYGGANRATITAVTTPRQTDGTVRLAINPTQFLQGYIEGRFVTVAASQAAVTYVCVGADGSTDGQGNGRGTLFRRSGYGFTAAAPSACPGVDDADVVATGLLRCSFIYGPNQGGTQQNGLVSLQLEVARGGEVASLAAGVHVDNVP